VTKTNWPARPLARPKTRARARSPLPLPIPLTQRRDKPILSRSPSSSGDVGCPRLVALARLPSSPPPSQRATHPRRRRSGHRRKTVVTETQTRTSQQPAGGGWILATVGVVCRDGMHISKCGRLVVRHAASTSKIEVDSGGPPKSHDPVPPRMMALHHKSRSLPRAADAPFCPAPPTHSLLGRRRRRRRFPPTPYATIVKRGAAAWRAPPSGAAAAACWWFPTARARLPEVGVTISGG
jgi:hypothetical protein